MPEAAEFEVFWSTMYPFLFPEPIFKLAEAEVDRTVALVNFKGGNVLDLACGPGRHSIVLARKGHKVTGVEISAYLVEKARERAKAENVEVEFVQQDMRDFRRPETFDLVLSMYHSFGYFDDKADDLKVLRNIHDSLVPGGSIVMDIFGKELIARDFEAISGDAGALGLNTLGGGNGGAPFIIETHEISDAWNRIKNQWLLIKGDKVTTFQFTHWLYSAQELKEKFEETGFQNIRLAGDFRGNEYGVKAQRLVVIASK
jgi:SAM-dependent methyltransferase